MTTGKQIEELADSQNRGQAMIDRDQIEANMDLSDVELRAAEKHLRDLLKHKGQLTGCTSYIQRKMQIGYIHAARIMDYLEASRFISEPDADGERRFR